MTQLDALGHRLDRFDLVGAVDDPRVDFSDARGLAELVDVGEPFQVVLREEAADLAGRIEAALPEPDLVAIGEKDEGIDPVLDLYEVRVIGGLSFAFRRISRRTLDLDEGQWSTLNDHQGIVDELSAGPRIAVLTRGETACEKKFIDHAARRPGPARFRKLAVDPLGLGRRLKLRQHACAPRGPVVGLTWPERRNGSGTSGRSRPSVGRCTFGAYLGTKLPRLQVVGKCGTGHVLPQRYESGQIPLCSTDFRRGLLPGLPDGVGHLLAEPKFRAHRVRHRAKLRGVAPSPVRRWRGHREWVRARRG